MLPFWQMDTPAGQLNHLSWSLSVGGQKNSVRGALKCRDSSDRYGETDDGRDGKGHQGADEVYTLPDICRYAGA